MHGLPHGATELHRKIARMLFDQRLKSYYVEPYRIRVAVAAINPETLAAELDRLAKLDIRQCGPIMLYIRRRLHRANRPEPVAVRGARA